MTEKYELIDQAKTDEVFEAARQVTEQLGMLADQGQIGIMRPALVPRDLIPVTLLERFPDFNPSSGQPESGYQHDLSIQTFYPSDRHNQLRLRATIGIRRMTSSPRAWYMTYTGIDAPGFPTTLQRIVTCLGEEELPTAQQRHQFTEQIEREPKLGMHTASMHEAEVVLGFLRDYVTWRHDNS